MPPSSSSSPSHLLPLLLLLLPLVLPTGAAEDADCSGSFRAGRENFVLDAEDAAKEGGALLSTGQVRSDEVCRSACCKNPRCSVALLEPRDGAKENRTCVLFSCVCRNRFVCRFVNQAGYQSYIRGDVFKKYLQGPGSVDQAPPIAITSRDVVIQPGKPVTLNGVQSLPLGDAHITDYHWTRYSGADSVNMEKTDHPDQVVLSNLQPGSYVFKLTVTDSNDKSQDAKVNVLVLNSEQSHLYCLAPAKVGPCRAAIPRWRYDGFSGQCEQFLFGGCKANHNNYLSKDDCLSACSGVEASTERSGPSTILCGDACRPDMLMCGNTDCCVDRSLECDGVVQCINGADERHCNKLNQTFNRLLDIDVNQRKARCAEPPRTGPCRANFVRYYYDPRQKECFRFTYGGCDGNENNFDEEEQCSSTCKGVTEKNVYFGGIFDRFGAEEEEHDSGNIALAVCLSVAILALLAVLTYCFLKARKDRSHRPVSTGPAHVALSEQDTLVYNPTTKPV